jgi:hypothetical protein
LRVDRFETYGFFARWGAKDGYWLRKSVERSPESTERFPPTRSFAACKIVVTDLRATELVEFTVDPGPTGRKFLRVRATQAP